MVGMVACYKLQTAAFARKYRMKRNYQNSKEFLLMLVLLSVAQLPQHAEYIPKLNGKNQVV
jgi:hypothetical protein